MARKKKAELPFPGSLCAWKCRHCGEATLEHKDGSLPTQCSFCFSTEDPFNTRDFVRVHEPVPVGFVLMKCNGEAHRNIYIDHCMVCLVAGGVRSWYRSPKAEQPADRPDGVRPICGEVQDGWL